MATKKNRTPTVADLVEQMAVIVGQLSEGQKAINERLDALTEDPAYQRKNLDVSGKRVIVQATEATSEAPAPRATRLPSPDLDLQQLALETGATERRVAKANRMFAKGDAAGLTAYHEKLVSEGNRRYVSHLIARLQGAPEGRPAGKRGRATGSTASQATKRASKSPPSSGLSMEPAAIRSRLWRAKEKALGRDPYRKADNGAS